MATPTYDPKKAELYNKLRQQGVNEEQAWTQAGITPAEEFNYAINDSPYNDDGTKNTNRGQMGPLIIGSGTITTPPSAAERAESDAFYKSLESSNFERVDYPVTANSQPSAKTPMNYTTTSTETVSGGGSTTTTSGLPRSNAQSDSLQAQADIKTAEIARYNELNPVTRNSTPEQIAERRRVLGPLIAERNQLSNQAEAAKTPTEPTTTTVPNTTTTTSTTTFSQSSNNSNLQTIEGPDPALNQTSTLANTQVAAANAQAVQTEGEITTDSLGNSFKTVDGEAVLFRAAEVQTEGETTTDSLGNSFKTVDGEAVLFRAAETDDTYYTDPADGNVYRDGALFRAAEVDDTYYTDPADGNVYRDGNLFRAAEVDDTYYTDPADGNVYRDGNLFRAEDVQTEGEITTDSLGNSFKTVDGEAVLFRAAEVDDTYYTDPVDGNVYRDGALYRAAEVQTEGEITTDSLGNSYKTIYGEAVLYRAAEVTDTGEDEYTTDSLGNSYKNGTLYRAAEVDEDAVAGAEKSATLTKAQQQNTLQQRYKQPGNQDWRVRLVLAEGANYLYKDTANQLLKPLMNANGVIFPYTPSIAVNYTANYDKTELTHSNYRGYFYKGSAVGDVTITATFTAQDTAEAQYLLAVIHFFRSVTKMFYGQDAQRGAPPPLLYLVGLGEFQFNGHPCVVSNFQYTLPTDVDYIRASSPNNYGINLLNRRTATTTPSNPISSVLNRLQNSGLFPGANPKTTTPAPGPTTGTVNNTQRPTYVPTKMDMTIQLLPLQTRSQVSQQFSVKEFANGNLLKGGFW